MGISWYKIVRAASPFRRWAGGVSSPQGALHLLHSGTRRRHGSEMLVGSGNAQQSNNNDINGYARTVEMEWRANCQPCIKYGAIPYIESAMKRISLKNLSFDNDRKMRQLS